MVSPSLSELKETVTKLQGNGYTEEQIARSVSQMRREIGANYKGYFDEDALKIVYDRNINKYGDPLGPSVDYLRAQGKSWSEIIDSACRTGGQDLNDLWKK